MNVNVLSCEIVHSQTASVCLYCASHPAWTKGRSVSINETVAEFKESVGAALKDALSLEIKTGVGVVDPATVDAFDGDLAFTKIDLLDGDIQTYLPAKFVTDPAYGAMKDFHLDREKQGLEIIEKNIEALRSAVTLAERLVS